VKPAIGWAPKVPLAGVAELADARDLGSRDESRGGSNPSARTIPEEGHIGRGLIPQELIPQELIPKVLIPKVLIPKVLAATTWSQGTSS
jgi:hypothetical protein